MVKKKASLKGQIQKTTYYCFIYAKFLKRQTIVQRRWAETGDESLVNFLYLSYGGSYKTVYNYKHSSTWTFNG